MDVADAIIASKRFDDAALWIWNVKKGQIFTSEEGLAAKLEELAPPIGPRSEELELLGIIAPMRSQMHSVVRTRAEKRADHELTRIRMACPDADSRNRRRRVRLVR